MAHILLVDDSSAVRIMITSILEQAGYEVEACSSAQIALRRLRAGDVRYDLVITDLHMPNLSGIELVRTIRADGAVYDVPVVIMTTERDHALKVEARTSGATGWVTKPMASGPLLKAVRMLLPLPERV